MTGDPPLIAVITGLHPSLLTSMGEFFANYSRSTCQQGNYGTIPSAGIKISLKIGRF